MTYWNGHGVNGWGVGPMTVGMPFFRALVILGVIALARHLGRTAPHSPAAPTAPAQRPAPEQLLAGRRARGGIHPDEYRTRPDTLRGGDPPA